MANDNNHLLNEKPGHLLFNAESNDFFEQFRSVTKPWPPICHRPEYIYIFFYIFVIVIECYLTIFLNFFYFLFRSVVPLLQRIRHRSETRSIFNKWKCHTLYFFPFASLLFSFHKTIINYILIRSEFKHLEFEIHRIEKKNMQRAAHTQNTKYKNG